MITIYNGNETIELLTDDNSYSYEAVMGEDALTLYFSHPLPVYPRGFMV